MKHNSNFNCQIKDKNVLKKRKKNGAVVNVYWVNVVYSNDNDMHIAGVF